MAREKDLQQQLYVAVSNDMYMYRVDLEFVLVNIYCVDKKSVSFL